MSLTGLLLVGHGSRLEYNKQLITTTAELMKQERPDYLIKSCFLEYSSPTVPEGLDSMRSESISRLVVVPLFLAKGIHVLRDIPRLLGLDTGKKQGSFLILALIVLLTFQSELGTFGGDFIAILASVTVLCIIIYNMLRRGNGYEI